MIDRRSSQRNQGLMPCQQTIFRLQPPLLCECLVTSYPTQQHVGWWFRTVLCLRNSEVTAYLKYHSMASFRFCLRSLCYFGNIVFYDPGLVVSTTLFTTGDASIQCAVPSSQMYNRRYGRHLHDPVNISLVRPGTESRFVVLQRRQVVCVCKQKDIAMSKWERRRGQGLLAFCIMVIPIYRKMGNTPACFARIVSKVAFQVINFKGNRIDNNPRMKGTHKVSRQSQTATDVQKRKSAEAQILCF